MSGVSYSLTLKHNITERYMEAILQDVLPFSWLNNLHRKLIHGGRELEQGKFTTDTLRQHRQYSILQGNVEPFLLVLVYISWIKIKIAQEHIQLSFYLVYTGKCICIITETRERNIVDHSLIKVWVQSYHALIQLRNREIFDNSLIRVWV